MEMSLRPRSPALPPGPAVVRRLQHLPPPPLLLSSAPACPRARVHDVLLRIQYGRHRPGPSAGDTAIPPTSLSAVTRANVRL